MLLLPALFLPILAACGGQQGAAPEAPTEVAETTEATEATEPTTETEAETPTEADAEEEPTEADAEEEPTEETAAAEGDLLVVSAPDCEYGGILQEIAAIDEMTVQFTMCRPDPAFPVKAAFVPFSIQPSEHLEATDGSPLENPVGTGPYMVDTWDRGEQVVYTRFEDYWGDPAQTETLVFRWSAEAAQRLLELQQERWMQSTIRPRMTLLLPRGMRICS